MRANPGIASVHLLLLLLLSSLHVFFSTCIMGILHQVICPQTKCFTEYLPCQEMQVSESMEY